MKHYEKNALAYRLEMKEVRLNPQTTAWTLNGLGTELRDGRFLRYFPIRDAGRMAFGAILVLGAALCARLFCEAQSEVSRDRNSAVAVGNHALHHRMRAGTLFASVR